MPAKTRTLPSPARRPALVHSAAVAFHVEHHRAPTVDDLAEATGMDDATVRAALVALESRGRVRRLHPAVAS